MRRHTCDLIDANLNSILAFHGTIKAFQRNLVMSVLASPPPEEVKNEIQLQDQSSRMPLKKILVVYLGIGKTALNHVGC